MRDEIDHQPAIEDRAFDGEARILETAVEVEGGDVLSLCGARERHAQTRLQAM